MDRAGLLISRVAVYTAIRCAAKTQPTNEGNAVPIMLRWGAHSCRRHSKIRLVAVQENMKLRSSYFENDTL